MFTNQRTRIAAVLFVVLAVVAAVSAILLRSVSTAQASSVIELNNPLEQDDVSPDMALQLDAIQNEAGISAWFNAGAPINLDDVVGRYHTIEARTAEYIIGSAQVPDYGDFHDVHVYIHKDGWFFAYYLRQDRVAKIVDIVHYPAQGLNTKFELVLSQFAAQAGVPFQTPKFWDFRYPNANRIMMIGESTRTGGYFRIKLPSAYSFYERSFALYSWIHLILDGVDLGLCDDPCDGSMTAEQLAVDITHEMDLNGSGVGALVLIYQEP